MKSTKLKSLIRLLIVGMLAVTILTTRVQSAAYAALHVDNPFVGATAYLNPDYAEKVNQQATQTAGRLGEKMAQVATYPTAVWIDRIGAITGTAADGTKIARSLREHLDAALGQKLSGKPITFLTVFYNLPNRDCHALASNGEISHGGIERYKTQYIDPITEIFSDPKYAPVRIVAVIEPDSLPNLVTNLATPACAQAKSSGEYVEGIQYALDKLHPIPNVYTYVDLGHSGWLGWDSAFGPTVALIAETIKGTQAGMNAVDGFISNTSGSSPTVEPFVKEFTGDQPSQASNFYDWNPHVDEVSYMRAMYDAFVAQGLPKTVGMLVDTSRNGWGGPNRPTAASTSTDVNTFVDESRIDQRPHRGGWCNQIGMGIGERPVPEPYEHFDAFVWVKPPGESDGISEAGIIDPHDPAKGFDGMCDPNGTNRDNSKYSTNAMAGAPHAGWWFAKQFEMLVENAYPPLIKPILP
ncbi:glycoside hydrolase family 6 protein [Leptothoe sp. PORK10 BA2]|uniref:glycoside hydrolase family 6 protein n=1 Tax=Leptothoe sp. PORK10 BA2 TaxID=3110254 RepID=UPI002B211B38|nr:glycoside hydrolase family 6 protein [Leptothoe sp. PORK10 BA2]MEA5466394.1 glycoside hydrolase family 6 protein [Leptothoe sp. PORK10 BA2]